MAATVSALSDVLVAIDFWREVLGLEIGTDLFRWAAAFDQGGAGLD